MNIDINAYSEYRAAILSMVNECDQLLQSPNYTDARKGELMGKVVLKYTA